MRFVPRLALALALAAAPAFASPGSCAMTRALPLLSASVSADPDVNISQESYVGKGEVHEGDLVSVMGNVRIDGEVTGQVVVVLGSLDVSGKVDGQVVSVMSKTHLASTAEVLGDLNSIGWSVQRDSGSKVDGAVVNVGFMNLLPFMSHTGGLAGIIRFLFLVHLIRLAFLFVILLLITALMPRRLAVIAAAFPQRWGWAFLVGLLTYCGVIIGTVILAVTVIGIPLALALWYITKGVKWLGLASIFYLMGQTGGRNIFKRELPHLASVLGGFVVYALLTLVPVLGWVFTLVMSTLAVGIVVVTRFGAEPASQPRPDIVTSGSSVPATAPAGLPGSIPPTIGS